MSPEPLVPSPLRAASSAGAPRPDLEAPVARAELDAARLSELTLARVRVLAIGLLSVAYLIMAARPSLIERDSLPAWFALPIFFWLGLALGMVALLRRGYYHLALQSLIPLSDAAFVLLLNRTAWLAMPSSYFGRAGVMTNVGITCALLAASGGVRPARGAALLTVLLALSTFTITSAWTSESLEWGPLIYSWVLLAAVGLFTVWIREVTRRAARSDVGRLLLERFLPREVIDRAHDAPLELVSEPRQVEATVVVTDLRGFTALAEHLPPADVLGLLSQVQGALADVIYEHGGHVDKFIGDGMLAAFGVLGPLPDHASRALRAAAGLRDAIDKLNRAGRAPAPLRLGIGIHSGPLVAGCIGAGRRLEFTVIGDTVNTAARLESMTKDLGVDVLVSDATRRLVADPGQLSRLPSVGTHPIRGRSAPLELYRLSD